MKFLLVLVCTAIINSASNAGDIKLIDDIGVASEIEILKRWIPEQLEYYHVPGLAIGIIYDHPH
jgi:hypothetical protein